MNLKSTFTIILLCWLYQPALTQKRHNLRIIEGDEYKTPLIGATIYFQELEKGAVSNISGYISIKDFPSGKYHARISFLGYETIEQDITLPLSSDLHIVMTVDSKQLQDVLVEESAITSVQLQQAKLSTINISKMNLAHIPRMLGEPDLIRMIQNLPGVKTETDFTGGFFVRGGRNDQNLILLDGVPVYNPWHLFGLFSAFNTEAIDRVELTKGVFPAQYGSRLSSVLDIELQKGDTQNGAGYLTISPISASFSYGKPINQKTSFLISGRRTYLDPIFWITDPILSTPTDTYKNRYNFFDLNFKVVHKFNPNTRLETGFFYGNDQLTIESDYTYVDEYPGAEIIPKDKQPKYNNTLKYGWRNITGSAKLIQERTKFKSISHLFTSWYQADNQYYRDEINDLWGYTDGYVTTAYYFDQHFKQYFTDLGAQQDFSFYLSDELSLSVGGQWLFHQFTESNISTEQEYGFEGEHSDFFEEIVPPSELIFNNISGDTAITNSHELSTYITAAIQLGNLSIYPGIRYQHFSQGNYHHVLPRINLNYQVNKALMISAGYGHFSQYLQTLSLDFMQIPANRWFWSNENRPPALSKTITAGIGYSIPKVGLLSIEGYYKYQTGLLNFSTEQQSEAIDNEGFIPQFSQETLSGTGEAYGIEFMLNKTKGKVTGWLGYTLSWAYNQFDEMNNGNPFPSRVDKRHDIQAFVNWDFAENWSLGALFNYKTGQPLTFSTQNYMSNPDPLGIGDQVGDNQVTTSYNNFRLPAYHRLDINLTWKNRRFFKHRTEVSLNIINAYNQFNVLTVTSSTSLEALPNGKFRAFPNNKYISQMTIMPVFSLRIGLGKNQKWKD
ncbi:MAG: TonB-dependent receptor [Reichenbachiella sp.]